jgi:AcrR family transcriptional regulator
MSRGGLPASSRAGVTAMMVNRYFGSQEGLFGAGVTDSMRDPVILSDKNLASPDIARLVAVALVGLTETGKSPLDGLLILFRSASSETAAAIARKRIAAAHQATVRGVIKCTNAPERAGILLAVVAGIQMMRQVMRLEVLADADPVLLANLMTPILTAVLGR